MYEKIKVLQDDKGPYKLDLVNWVPLEYIEMVFNATIQIVTAIEFAHAHGLIHGQLDLSRVWITQRRRLEGNENEEDEIFDAYSNLEFEVTDFAPTLTMKLPLEPEAGIWPFAKGKDPEKLTKQEKMEVLKLRDIYAIGVCILEMMLGRYASLRTNIDIDNIPTEWGNLPESSTLIQVLLECIQLTGISSSHGKLTNLRKLLIQDFKKHFNKNYRFANPFVGKKADVLNKVACVKYFNFEAKRETVIEEAENLWKKAIMSYNQHYYSCFNLGMSKFLRGEFDIDQLIADFNDDVFINKSQGNFTEACLLLAAGKRSEGVESLKNYIDSFKHKALTKRRGLNAKQK